MSLRVRLTLLSGAVLVLALVSFTAVTVNRAERVLERRNDEEMTALSNGMIAVGRQQVRRIESGRQPFRYESMRPLHLPGSFDGYSVVVLPDRSTVPLPQLTNTGSPVPNLPDDVLERSGKGTFQLNVAKGGTYSARVIPIPDTDAVVFVSISRSAVDAAIAEVVRTHVITGVVLLMILMIVAAFAVRFGLRPLTSVTAAAERIAGGSLADRVPPGPDGTEIGALTSALNEMLATIDRVSADRENALRRTEQFAADAAHELRTPTTAILGYAQLYQHGGIEGEVRLGEVFERIDHEATRLADLVEALVLLDSINHENTERQPDSFDAVEVCRAVAADSMTIDPDHPVLVEPACAVLVRVPSADFFQIVANLVANVRRHTPPLTSTTITVRSALEPSLRAQEPRRIVHVDVADDGHGIAAKDADRIFDRFYRSDPARARSSRTDGSGLGLAIVRSLAKAAGGEASLLANGPDGATFRVTLRPGDQHCAIPVEGRSSQSRCRSPLPHARAERTGEPI